MRWGGIFLDRHGCLRFLWIIAMALVVLASGAALLRLGITAWDGAACERKGNSRGVEAHYGGWLDSTCYVTTPEGRILTLEQYDVNRSEIDLKVTDER